MVFGPGLSRNACAGDRCGLQPHNFNSRGETAEGQCISRRSEQYQQSGPEVKEKGEKGRLERKRGDPGTYDINSTCRRRAFPSGGS